MTNEQIAKIIGAKIIHNELGIEVYDFHPEQFIEQAKLLQAKMVADGWGIEICNWKEELPGFPPKIYFSINAININLGKGRWADAETEPAAIVSLFEKIYGEQA